MVDDDILKHTTVWIDGRLLPIGAVSFSWDTPPGQVRQDINTIQDPHTRKLLIQDSYAAGTIEILDYENPYSSDPLKLMDALGFTDVASYYDTVTERVIHSSKTYDFTDEQSGMLGRPELPIELRQIESSVSDSIESDSTYRKFAFRFKAGGEDIHLLRLMLNDITGTEVTAFNLEVWTDNAGEPNAIVASSNTVVLSGLTIPSDTSDWYTVDDLEAGATNDLLDGEKLTVGDWYWLVVIATDTDPLYLGGTTNINYSGSDVKKWNNTLAQWDDVGSSMANATFILQFYHEYGGHTVKVRSEDDTGLIYKDTLCKACDIIYSNPSIETRKAGQSTFKFESNSVEITKNP